MFQVDKFYTHPGMYDCVLKILNVNKDLNDDYSIRIMGITKSGVVVSDSEYVTIKKEDEHKWKEYVFK